VGLVRDKEIVDLTLWLLQQEPVLVAEQFDMVDLIAAPADIWEQIVVAGRASEGALKGADAWLPMEMERLLAPISRPRKNIFCLGRNYAEHAAESLRAFGQSQSAAVAKPDYPAIFTKAPTTVIGPFEAIVVDPGVSVQIDWEVELAIVIGRGGRNIRREEAKEHIFGYTVLNDVSARDIQQRHGGQFFKGKSLDGSCPMGPWIVTADEVPDPDNLELWTRVNGVEKQHDNTASMMFGVAEIIEQLSFGMTLEPGDIIATGTPAGVGHARQPAEYLRPGDTVECEVAGVGVIRNPVISAEN
jgi:2-keto-4-pentenoate hydratase/2-oxohepta-3-ene-1,7-dioic acid hydratase in catechol pathway